MKIKRKIVYITMVITTISSLVSSFSLVNLNASAADMSKFDAGNIVSDEVMSDYKSMSEVEIQDFLTDKNSCSNTNYSYYQQLSTSGNRTWHWEDGHFVCLSEELFGDGETIGSGDTAAHIIWQAAQDYHINPQILISLIQRESGLITDPIPSNTDYRLATGYNCPDPAACSQYYGLKNQIRNSASLFHSVLEGGWSNYPAYETSYIQYSPNASCGGDNVYIENRATSALYRYSPYQPNEAALNAGYGTGDSCSFYSNRNFYNYFHDWFDEPQEIDESQDTSNDESQDTPDETDSLSSETQTVKINPDDISNQTYIIGTHMFTRDKSLPTYPGYITTKSIMFAAQTITGDRLNDMKIFYKTARGIWVDGTTNTQIAVPEFFEIAYRNMETISAQTHQAHQTYQGYQNTYPWQNNCPGERGAFITYWDGKAIGGYVCENTSYASWKVYERYGIAPAWGNAYDWDNVASNLGYRVDNQPEAGSVGQADGGTYGHVFWVESVNSDGSVNATEYNNAYATQLYLGSFHYGDFGSRVIPAGEAMTYNYIHF